MPPHRKKPFSAKQKKKQLQNKRKRNQGQDENTESGKHSLLSQHSDSSAENSAEDEEKEAVRKFGQQPAGGQAKKYDPNRYRLHFLKESREEIERRKKIARTPLTSLPESDLEIDLQDVYRPGSVLDIPKRPPWNYRLNKEVLLTREEQYFREYLENIFEKHTSEELSYIELNLETWRQLWRVLEMSDVVLLITDIRHPALHFAPTLYDYITKELKKHIILVLNKIDLAPPGLVAAWKHYFHQNFPRLHIVLFTSFPSDATLNEKVEKVFGKRHTGHSSPCGPSQILKACEQIVQGHVELNSWREKILEDRSNSDFDHKMEPDVKIEESDGTYTEHVQYKDGILTIGCCGYPNVGKSSVINALVGKKVVSVSRTPGHTKHFQTIFLTNTVKLCDCPGLVFPSLVCKPLQILAGMYPIAQVAEPYTTVGYLGQRIPLPELLNIHHPDGENGQKETTVRQWTAYDICDAWAQKRGYLTAKAARPDTYRAANSILRLALEGRLRLCSHPPGFASHKAFWKKHPDAQEIALNQKAAMTHTDEDSEEEISASDDNEKDTDEAEDLSSESDGQGDRQSVGLSNPFALLGTDD